MAKRFVDTELDDKPWFNELPCRLKCAVQYIFRKCDSAGIWEPNYVIATAYVGEGGFKESEILCIDGGGQFEKLPNGKIFVTGFCDFQYGTLSEDCKPHRPVIQKLKKHNLYERVSKGYKKGIDTLQEKDKEKEEEKDKDKDTLENAKKSAHWDSAKAQFLQHTEWMTNFCRSKNISAHQFDVIAKEFVSDLELKLDYKPIKEIKSHFTSWFNKNKSSLLTNLSAKKNGFSAREIEEKKNREKLGLND